MDGVWTNANPLPAESDRPGNTGKESWFFYFGDMINPANGNLYLSNEDLSVDARGFDLRIERSYNSHRSSQPGPFGFGWTHNYNLRLVEKANGSVVFFDGDGSIHTFTEESDGYKSPPGVHSRLTKNESGYVLWRKNGTKLRFNTAGVLTLKVGRNGNHLYFEYTDGKLTTVKDDSGQQLTLEYTDNGRIASVTGPLNRTITYRYEAGDLIEVVDPMGNSIRYTYYDNHKLKAHINRLNIATVFSYAAEAGPDRVTEIRFARYRPASDDYVLPAKMYDFEYNDSARMMTVLNRQGRKTTVRVNNQGNPTRVTRAGVTATMQWDDDMNRVRLTDPNGNTYQFEYDFRGNLINRTGPLGRSTTFNYRNIDTDSRYISLLTNTTDAKGRTTSFEYDEHGNLVTVTDPAGNQRHLTYTDNGFPKTIVEHRGGETIRQTFSYDPRGNLVNWTDATGATTHYGYDAAGRLVNVTDGNGHTTTYVYDANDRIVKKIDPLGHETRYIYDAVGQLVNTIDAKGNNITDTSPSYVPARKGDLRGLTNTNTNKTRYFDVLGRVVAIEDAHGNMKRFSYDENGNLIRKTAANGNVTRYNYDARNRLVREVPPTGPAINYTYDAVGNLISVEQGDKRVKYRYDSLDRLVNVTVDFGPFTKTIRYEYDSQGNRVKTIDPEGGVTTYDYDKANRVTEIIGPANRTFTFSYDAVGKVTATTFPNNVTTNYQYDAAGRLVNLTATRNGSTVTQFAYTYDSVGNVLSVTNADGETTSYGYDDQYRLTSVTTPSGETTTYTYDATGNRLTETTDGETTRYTYDAAGRLRSAGETNHTYDTAGNLISRTTGSNTTRFTYNSRNRLTGVELPDGDRIRYEYSPVGNRLSKTTNGETTYYLHSFEDVLMEFDENGSMTARYIHGPGIDDLLGMVRSGRIYYYHQDGLGSIRALTDAGGDVAATYDYDAFGTITEQTGEIANPYTFTGRRLEPESGLYFYRARYYDSSVGRFTREDPLRSSALEPNLYAYARNNPTSRIDPHGLRSFSGWVKKGVSYVTGYDEETVDEAYDQLGQEFYEKAQQADSYVEEAKEAGGVLWAGTKGFFEGGWEAIKWHAKNIYDFWKPSGELCKIYKSGATWRPSSQVPGGKASQYILGGTLVSVLALGGGILAYEGGWAAWQFYLTSPEAALGLFGVATGAPFTGGVPNVWDVVGAFVTGPKAASWSVDLFEEYCDDDDDDGGTTSGAGGDHADDNRDLSVLSYTRVHATPGTPDAGLDYNGTDIAVFSRGFSAEATDLLISLNETPNSVDLQTTQEVLNRYEVLVIPSGGLFGLSSLSSFEDKLERYVGQGGTLIVFPQQRGYEFDPVPGRLDGYGWREDQSCQYGSVGITTFCSILASLDDETADINVDGYFTDYPDNATILLTRTKNSQPAMLTYEYGSGRVLATAAYTDWASGHHADTREGRRLINDVLTWAKRPANISTYSPGDRASLSVNVTSHIDMTADSVRFTLVGPDGTEEVETVSTVLSAFDTRSIEFTHSFPEETSLGIWNVKYALVNDSRGVVQRGHPEARFAVARFKSIGEGWTAGTGNISVAVTSDAERYPRGSNASFTITVRNDGNDDKTVTLWWSFPHNYWRTEDPIYGAPGTTIPGHDNSNLNRTLTVPADGKRTINYTVPVYSFDRLWVDFYEGGRSSQDKLGESSRSFFVFDPAVDLDIRTDHDQYSRGDNVTITVTQHSDSALNTTTEIRVLDPTNDPILQDRIGASLTPGRNHTLNITARVPQDSAFGSRYTIIAEPFSGNQKVGHDTEQFLIPDSILRISPTFPDALRNGSSVGFTIRNKGQKNASNTTLEVSLIDPGGATVWTTTETFAVPINGSHQVSIPFRLDSLRFGKYRFEYALTYGNNTTINRDRVLSSSAIATVEFNESSYRVRDAVGVTLTVTNDGDFVDDLGVTVSVPDAGYTNTTGVTLRPEQNATRDYTVELPDSLSPGKHSVVVTLDLQDSIRRTATFFVPKSELTLDLPSGPHDAGNPLDITLANQGGVDTTAACSLAFYGPDGTLIDRNRTQQTVAAGRGITLPVEVPEQTVSGSHFLDISCEDSVTNTTTDRSTSIPVVGANATVASTTDKQVYTAGENVTITVNVTNHDGPIQNGTLRVKVLDPSVEESTTTTTAVTTAIDSHESRRRSPSAGAANLSERYAEPTRTEPVDPRNVTDQSGRSSSPAVRGTAGNRTRENETRIRTQSRTGDFDPTLTPLAGNRSIENETVWTDRRIVLNRSLVVNTTGNLTLQNTTLIVNNTEDSSYGIEVRDGGELRLLSGSNVTALDPEAHYYFRALSGSTLVVRNASVSEVGTRFNGLYIGTDGAVIRNSSITDAPDHGLVVDSANDTRIIGNHLSGNEFDSIRVTGTSLNATIAGNDLIGEDGGIVLMEGIFTDTTIARNTFTGGDLDLGIAIHLQASNATVQENRIGDSDTGIVVRGSNNTVVGNNVTGVNYDGIDIDEGSHNALVNNTVADFGQRVPLIGATTGIETEFETSHTTITNNNVSGRGTGRGDIGISVDAESAVLHNNTVDAGETGVMIEGDNITLTNNTISPFDDQFVPETDLLGLHLLARNATLRNNSLSELRVTSQGGVDPLNMFLHDIDTSNTVPSGSIYYWVNRSDATVPGDTGATWLINASNVTVMAGTDATLAFTQNSTVRNVNASGDIYGIYLRRSDNNTIVDSHVTDNRRGVYLDHSDGNAITANNISHNGERGIEVEVADDNVITGNTITATGASTQHSWGIDLWGDNNTIVENTVTQNDDVGIDFVGDNNTLTENNVSYNRGEGVVVDSFDVSSRNRIAGNTISNNSHGIVFDGELSEFGHAFENNTILGNDIGNNDWDGIRYEDGSVDGFIRNTIRNNGGNGLEIAHAVDTIITDNRIFRNDQRGIQLDSSRNATLRNNTLTRNDFRVQGDQVGHFLHDIETTNTVTSGPIYYWVNRSDAEIPADAGTAWVINSTNITVSAGNGAALIATTNSTVANLTASEHYSGIFLFDSHDNLITNSKVTNNTHGVYLENSNNNTITDIMATSNGGPYAGAGIMLVKSTNNTVGGSNTSNNEDGIVLRNADSNDVTANVVSNNTFNGVVFTGALFGGSSTANTLKSNRIVENGVGINLIVHRSKNNLIYNNYIDNPEGTNAIDEGEDNRWNVTKRRDTNVVGGAFLGGNFWRDYEGVDTDGDGIGDTRIPYNSSGEIVTGGDFLPLTKPRQIGNVFWETNTTIDVSADGTRTLKTKIPSDILSDANGKFKLATTLSSTTNQTIASEDPSFYIVEGNTSITLETDEQIYEPNETIHVSGVISNNGSTTRQYNLTVTKRGTPIFIDSFTLEPGENHSYAITTAISLSGSVSLTATAETDAGNVTVQDSVDVVEPTINATLIAPDRVGREPFTASVLVENPGDIEATLNVTLGKQEAWTITVAPGESQLLETTMSIDDNTTLTATISGDEIRTLKRNVTFGEGAQITISPKRIYPEGQVEVPYTITNTGLLKTRFNATFTLRGRAITREVFLPAGTNVSESLLVNLTAGNYTLEYSSPLGEKTTTFRVAERNQLRLDSAVPANATNGTLRVNVTIRNVGPNDVQGILVANSSIFLERKEFNVNAGENATLNLTIALPTEIAPGRYPMSIQAVTEATVIAEQTDAFAIRKPRFEIVSVSRNKSFGLGQQASLNVTLENTGTATGPATMNVTVPGIFQGEETVWISSGDQANLTVSFQVPDDLSEDTYPVEFSLDGTRRETSIFVRGAKVNVTASLDRKLYRDGENATLTLHVENERDMDTRLFSRVKFNDYDVVKNYSLAGSENRTLTFEVPVRFDGDNKIFFSVYADSGRSLYINGIAPHQKQPNVTLFTDQSVYDIGEEVRIHVEPTESGRLVLSAPGFTWNETVSEPTNVSFTVPPLRSGTYYVVYAFDNRTHSYPFDVAGYHAQVSEATLDKEAYVEGDDVALTLTLESDRNVSGTIMAELRDAERRVLDTSRTNASLRAGENEVTVKGDLPLNTAGIHSVVYRITTETSPTIPLTAGTEFFEVRERPEPTITYTPVEPAIGENVTFDATESSAPKGSIRTYEWDFDGDGSTDATGATATHAFGAAGNYSVTLTVTDDSGVEATATRTVRVAATKTTCIRKAVAGDDGRISLTEIQQAINWWAEDTAVPDTGGETISLSQIQSLINDWAEDNTVTC